MSEMIPYENQFGKIIDIISAQTIEKILQR